MTDLDTIHQALLDLSEQVSQLAGNLEHIYEVLPMAHALTQSTSTAAVPLADRRARRWRYIVRFWRVEEIGQELIGETESEVMEGTGHIPAILAQLAGEVHELGGPLEPLAALAKEKLQQFRNNLGRANDAALRLDYQNEGGEKFYCQMDVYRIEG